MLQLPNNCRLGKFSVFPKNWNTSKADLNLVWRITYWFYDDCIKQKRQFVIKMNKYKLLKERQSAVTELIKFERDLLERQGYNPITKQYNSPNDSEISEYTPLSEALEYVHSKMEGKVEKTTFLDIKSCLRYLKPAAVSLGYDYLILKDLKRKHIKILLDQCGRMKKKWTANNYNHYRKYLSVLFSELVEMDIMDVNLCSSISKQKTIKRIRETLTMEQREKVNDHLFLNYYTFWRFLNIFFHSGSRITELLDVKEGDVDLFNQKFKVTVKKGKSYREEWRTITDSCIELWEEVVVEGGPGLYLFGKSLKPSEKKITRAQITKRWRLHVKEKLGITADFYSLKHTNLDEISSQLGIKAASVMAGHTTPVVTMNHYLTGEKERTHESLKHISNTFGGGVKVK